MLWVALPFVAFVNLAALELDAKVGAGIAFGWSRSAAAWVSPTRPGVVLRLPRPSRGR